jgi:AcrR family transcriptional regulator
VAQHAEKVKVRMSPRPYRLGQRQSATDQTRARIVEAARDLLLPGHGGAGFSMEAVARQADVARMTVYYQFGSKAGLLEALFDHLAARGQIAAGLGAAFSQPDPLDALDGLIAAFSRFWASDRLVIRRLHALAVLDPEIERGDRERNERRRSHLRLILERIAERYGRPSAGSLDEAADILQTLTSFETFDSIAGATRGIEAVIPLVQRLARAAIGLDEARAAAIPAG